MSMTKLLYGLAALPLIAGVALAAPVKQSNDSKALAKQPTQLSEQQMDKVTAGWDIWIHERYNTGEDFVSVYHETAGTPGSNFPNPPFAADNLLVCTACYLLINNQALSVGSIIFGGPHSGP